MVNGLLLQPNSGDVLNNIRGGTLVRSGQSQQRAYSKRRRCRKAAAAANHGCRVRL
jgi:hypothetical protein